MFDWVTDEKAWMALATLTFLEIILGVDNVIFISILAGRLPAEQEGKARRLGLVLAMGVRILLLFSLSLIMKLTKPLFTVGAYEVSGRDLILIAGGLFLIWKSVHEIHNKLEGETGEESKKVARSFTSVIVSILLLDIVFSLDSVITAVGMASDYFWVMVLAVVLSVGFMLVFAGVIARFVQRHPTVKMLALAFLLMIGVSLIAEGLDHHIPKGYIYFAMAFSMLVESLNLRASKKAKPVELREPYVEEPADRA